MERTELLKSKEYWVSQFQIALFETVENYLKEKKITRSQFAEKMGVSKGYVSQILNGDFDHKISKYVELLLACEMAPVIKPVGLNEFIEKDGLTTANRSIGV